MQFWMYEQHQQEELEYLETSVSLETSGGEENRSSD